MKNSDEITTDVVDEKCPICLIEPVERPAKPNRCRVSMNLLLFEDINDSQDNILNNTFHIRLLQKFIVSIEQK